jgi:hypothetical protein
LRPKNLIGGDLVDLGPCRLIEDLEQATGVLAGFEGRPSQGRHARGGSRPRHDLEESPGDAEADALGLGDDGELGLLIGGDLAGELQLLMESLNFSVPLRELPVKPVDPGLDPDAFDGLDDLLGLAIERLPRLIALLGHRGDVAVSAAEDGEGAGDTLRDRGHGARSIEAGRGITPTIAHVPTGIVHDLQSVEEDFEKVPALSDCGQA